MLGTSMLDSQQAGASADALNNKHMLDSAVSARILALQATGILPHLHISNPMWCAYDWRCKYKYKPMPIIGTCAGKV